MHRVFIIIISISLFWSLVAVVASENQNKKQPVTNENSNLEDIQFRVVNGQPATLGQFPYQVSLKKYKRGSYMGFCGGSVIGLNKVLTAGHCLTYQKNICEKACGIYCVGSNLQNYSSDSKKYYTSIMDLQIYRAAISQYHIQNLEKIYAVAGTLRTVGYYTDDPSSPEQWRKFKKAVVAEGFSFPRRDICLAFTYTPFVINEYVKIFPTASRKMDYGSMQCMAAGYGRINNYITSDSLLWANLRLIPNSKCSLLHGRNMRDFICTSSDISTVLQGDSGGGLLCKNTGDPNDAGQGVIVGVVSGAAVKRTGYNTFFTRVTSYKKFISSTASATINSPVLCFVWLSPIISRFD